MVNQRLHTAAMVLLIVVLTVVILFYGRPFLVPFTIAALLAMLLVPVTRWLQSKRLNKILAVLLSLLLLISVIALVGTLIGWQINEIARDAAELEQQAAEKIKEFQKTIAERFGIPVEEQQQMIKKQQSSSASSLSEGMTRFIGEIGGFLTNTILVLVYVFLFIYFRDRVKQFIIRIVPATEKSNTVSTVNQVQQVSQKYLSGLAVMIVILWVMYGIGFSIVGVKHAMFFAVLCGLLELVPFIGNLTGTLITVLMSLAQGADLNLITGIIITYALVQFLQTYLLEPLVVGAGVNINPLFTIAGLVAGEFIWGIPGMILAIPMLGIAKIICDHVPSLHPYAYLIGTDKEGGRKEKLKKITSRIRKASDEKR
jgi:predicted PurR-regulated permease PerM